MTRAQRDELIRLASQVANNGDSLETDAIEAEGDDDLMALLSHAEILQRNLGTLAAAVRAVLESPVKAA